MKILIISMVFAINLNAMALFHNDDDNEQPAASAEKCHDNFIGNAADMPTICYQGFSFYQAGTFEMFELINQDTILNFFVMHKKSNSILYGKHKVPATAKSLFYILYSSDWFVRMDYFNSDFFKHDMLNITIRYRYAMLELHGFDKNKFLTVYFTSCRYNSFCSDFLYRFPREIAQFYQIDSLIANNENKNFIHIPPCKAFKINGMIICNNESVQAIQSSFQAIVESVYNPYYDSDSAPLTTAL